MSVILLDTNVISELVRPHPEPRVVAFLNSQTDPLISAVTLHEIAYGIDKARDRNRRAKLISWMASLRTEFQGRIVHVNENIAERSGQMRAAAESAGIIITPMDALIAASAAVHSAGVATRNVRDFAALGVAVIDPWK
ncbi:MAG: type II toxin-antitoxin system VapC family toxin [Hyphomonadaceae bacterium]